MKYPKDTMTAQNVMETNRELILIESELLMSKKCSWKISASYQCSLNLIKIRLSSWISSILRLRRLFSNFFDNFLSRLNDSRNRTFLQQTTEIKKRREIQFENSKLQTIHENQQNSKFEFYLIWLRFLDNESTKTTTLIACWLFSEFIWC